MMETNFFECKIGPTDEIREKLLCAVNAGEWPKLTIDRDRTLRIISFDVEIDRIVAIGRDVDDKAIVRLDIPYAPDSQVNVTILSFSP